MKINCPKADYDLEQPIGQILSVGLDTGTRTFSGFGFQLHQIEPADMVERRKADKASVLGRPLCFAIKGPRQIAIDPIPDQDAELMVSFYPPQVTL